MEMTRVLQEITSMVRSQKCMNPATWMMVVVTQKMTMQEARRLPRKTKTVRNIAMREVSMFWYSSYPIILSVSQLEYLIMIIIMILIRIIIIIILIILIISHLIAIGNTASVRLFSVSSILSSWSDTEMLDVSTMLVTRSMAGTHSEADWKPTC